MILSLWAYKIKSDGFPSDALERAQIDIGLNMINSGIGPLNLIVTLLCFFWKSWQNHVTAEVLENTESCSAIN